MRGIRNNNPGNIRISANPWRGKITGAKKRDKVFEEFQSIEYGYRALLKNLKTYIDRDRVNTIRAIITKWAPPEDRNDTEAYIRAVCQRMGVAAGYRIISTNKEDMIKLAAAITRVENGVDADMTALEKGWELM